MESLNHLHAIGLTGGIGSGKSLVSSILLEHHLTVIDADQLTRQLHHDPNVCKQLIDAFGKDIVDTSGEPFVIRPALAKVAFATDKNLKILNHIMHPAMERLIQNKIACTQNTIVLDAALLFEAGWQNLVQATVAVLCPLDIRIARIQARDGLSMNQIQSRIHAQMTDTDRIAHADYLIYNVGTIDLLRCQVKKLFNLING